MSGPRPIGDLLRFGLSLAPAGHVTPSISTGVGNAAYLPRQIVRLLP